jgi:hypothetical protein
VLSSAALPQPATVRGCPLTLDSSSASALNYRIKLAAQVGDACTTLLVLCCMVSPLSSTQLSMSFKRNFD